MVQLSEITWTVDEINSGSFRFSTARRKTWLRFLAYVGGLDHVRECKLEFGERGGWKAASCLVPTEYLDRLAFGLHGRSRHAQIKNLEGGNGND